MTDTRAESRHNEHTWTATVAEYSEDMDTESGTRLRGAKGVLRDAGLGIASLLDNVRVLGALRVTRVLSLMEADAGVPRA